MSKIFAALAATLFATAAFAAPAPVHHAAPTKAHAHAAQSKHAKHVNHKKHVRPVQHHAKAHQRSHVG